MFVDKLLLGTTSFVPGRPSLVTDEQCSVKSLTSWHAGLWHESLPAVRGADTAKCPAASFFSAWRLLPGPQDSPGHDISGPYFCKMCCEHNLETKLYLPS